MPALRVRQVIAAGMGLWVFIFWPILTVWQIHGRCEWVCLHLYMDNATVEARKGSGVLSII